MEKATGATGPGKVKDGDISICMYCGGINQYVISESTVDLVELPEDVLKMLQEEQPETYKQIMDYKTIIESRMVD